MYCFTLSELRCDTDQEMLGREDQQRQTVHIFCVMGKLGVIDLRYLLRGVGGLRRRGRPNAVIGDETTICGGIQRAGKNPQHWLNQM